MDPNRYYNYSDLGTIDHPKGISEIEASFPIPEDLESMEAPVALVYSLDNLSAKRPGAILCAGYGNQLKNIVRAANNYEARPLFTTGTDDKLRAFSFGNSAAVISLGKKFDERLFSNEYTLLQAAKACSARTILWAQPDPPSDLLKAKCKELNILLLIPLKGDKTYNMWNRAELDPAAREKYAKYLQKEDGHSDIVETNWRKCVHCGFTHDGDEVVEDGWVCPTCGSLYRLTSDERIAITFDEGSFEEWDAVVDERNPLDFPDFDSIIERAKDRSGYNEGVRIGQARIKGHPVVACIMEPSFIMGSMGSVVGEKITRAFERAIESKLPVVVFCASGGARMQEGLASLMQMAKVSAAVEAHDRAGLLYISVLTDPTTGGVTASFAMLGDIILAEPGTLIGFAGRRVIQDTIKQALPDDFQTAEFALEHGLIDAIVARNELRDVLGQILGMHDANHNELIPQTEEVISMLIKEKSQKAEAADDKEGDAAKADDSNLSRGQRFMNGLGDLVDSVGKSVSKQFTNASLWRAVKNQRIADAPGMKPHDAKQAQDADGTQNHAWESVQLARNAHRPTSYFYIASIVEDFIELHGDRAFADDGAIIGGIGRINGMPVTIVAEEKGADLKSRIARNFGSPQPEGYRKAQRLMKQADKFGRPIVCFVDTQGAFCGQEAEERGMGNAIAESLALMSGLSVPIISIVLGEGGSGGALALAVANRVAMQENAVYSVLSPEGFASILWKDGSRAPEAASVMKMSASDAFEMGMIEDIIPEGQQPAHENPDQAAAAVWLYITNALEDLVTKSPEELRQQRYDRFRAF